MNFNDEERDFYEDHLKWMMIEASTVKKAEEKAEARGENKKAIEIAKKMLSKNHSISDISDLTGLSPEEISKL